MATAKQFNIDGTLVDLRDSRELVTGVKGNSETTYRTGNVNITKANIGLSNVPNVTTNDQAPTFTQASTRANIASGETLTVIFGKIMKFFADLKAVAFSGSYNDLSDKPTIPTVNNATLTIQKNGTNVQTFTANSSSNKTANITVPTKTSELTNDSGFITNAGVTGVKGNSESTYRTGQVNITKSNIGLGSVGNFKAVSTVASQGLTDTEKTNARTNIGAIDESILNITTSTVVATLSNNQTYTVPDTGYYRLLGKIAPVSDTASHQMGFLLNDIYCIFFYFGTVPSFFQNEIPLILKKGTVIKYVCDVSGSTGVINKLF